MPATGTSRIDGLTTSVAVKAPCRVAATHPIVLSGVQTINGVTVQAGNPALNILPDRVLVTAQADNTTNGIYVVNELAWTRALDFDGARDAVQGTIISIYSGLDGIVFWQLTTANPVDFGDSAITFQTLATGVSIPTGGAEGQVLQKASSADFDIMWGDPSFPVLEVFGRTGNITASSGDYSIDQIDNAALVAISNDYNDLDNLPPSGTATTLSSVGSSPNVNAATLSSMQVLNLEPASSAFPGIITTSSQIFAGAKTFLSPVVASLAGNAATATALSSAHNIYGNPFDGTSDLTQIIASSFGGTNSSAVAFTGASSAVKIYTLPNSSATLACLDVVQSFTKQQTLRPLTLTSSGSSIAWDASSGNNAQHTATENTTLSNPTNLVNGTVYTFQWTQHASAAKTLSFGNKWKFAGGNTVSATLGAINIVTGLYDVGSSLINSVMTGPFS